jgi:hypothetical protein
MAHSPSILPSHDLTFLEEKGTDTGQGGVGSLRMWLLRLKDRKRALIRPSFTVDNFLDGNDLLRT